MTISLGEQAAKALSSSPSESEISTGSSYTSPSSLKIDLSQPLRIGGRMRSFPSGLLLQGEHEGEEVQLEGGLLKLENWVVRHLSGGV